MEIMNAIEVNDEHLLLQVLQTVHGAVEGGKLDVQIKRASDAFKAHLKSDQGLWAE